jgi:hypothetical protein
MKQASPDCLFDQRFIAAKVFPGIWHDLPHSDGVDCQLRCNVFLKVVQSSHSS